MKQYTLKEQTTSGSDTITVIRWNGVVTKKWLEVFKLLGVNGYSVRSPDSAGSIYLHIWATKERPGVRVHLNDYLCFGPDGVYFSIKQATLFQGYTKVKPFLKTRVSVGQRQLDRALDLICSTWVELDETDRRRLQKLVEKLYVAGADLEGTIQ